MTRDEFEKLAMQTANKLGKIGHIECPREVRNPGVYFGMMLAYEVMMNDMEKLEETQEVLAKLVLHLDVWALNVFDEGDYSEKWRELKNWSYEVLGKDAD